MGRRRFVRDPEAPVTTFLVPLPRAAGGGRRALLPIGFLARLPQPMLQFGIVLLVTTLTGSLGYAGMAAGALSLGSRGGRARTSAGSPTGSVSGR